MSLSPDSLHEFQVPANLLDNKGVLVIAFLNAQQHISFVPG
jgi:hypothetical protein